MTNKHGQVGTVKLKAAAFQFADYMDRREAAGLEPYFEIIPDPSIEKTQWAFPTVPEEGHAILYCNPSLEAKLKSRFEECEIG